MEEYATNKSRNEAPEYGEWEGLPEKVNEACEEGGWRFSQGCEGHGELKREAQKAHNKAQLIELVS